MFIVYIMVKNDIYDCRKKELVKWLSVKCVKFLLGGYLVFFMYEMFLDDVNFRIL